MTTNDVRYLSDAGLARITNEPKLVALLQYCRADPSLSIFLRGSTIDVYWEGFVVFHVTVSTGKIRVGSESDKLRAGLPLGLGPWDAARIPAYIAWVKEQRAAKVATSAPELRFEAAVIRDNQMLGSPVIVLDRQVARAGGKEQLDLMLLDVGTSRLAMAELKVARNPEIAGPVLAQLHRYITAFSEHGLQYAKVLEQMKALGLVANRRASVVPSKPLPIVMLAGVAVRKLGAAEDHPRLHQLYRADAAKRMELPDWDARLLLFPRQTEQSYTIATSLEDLPRIKDWCERNLTDLGA